MIPNGIYFHGGGGSFPYYLGIARYLQEHYDLTDVDFAGCSAGSIPAIALCAGLMKGDFYEKTLIPFLKDVRKANKKKDIMFPDAMLGYDWLNQLKIHVKEAIHKSGNFDEINKKCSLLITKVHKGDIKSEYITSWASIDDLMECVITSCWIPFLFGDIFKNFRKTECLDGGFQFFFSNFLPNPDKTHNWIHIGLTTFNRFEDTPFQALSNFAILCFAANEKYVSNLMKLGYKDAKKKSYKHGLACCES